MDPSSGPVFGAPPVIETVLGAQFAAVKGYTAAHSGCFWQSKLSVERPEWKDATFQEMPKIDDVREEFASEPSFGRPYIRVEPAGERNRVQIIRSGGERMIQLQDSRFIYNWRKQQGHYPTFATIRPEFDTLYGDFIDYLRDAGLAEPVPNQWEVIYVNHIPKGSLWSSVSEWPQILTGLYIPAAKPNAKFETVAGEWRYRLATDRARLHIALRHGRTEVGEVLILQLTARGPVDTSRGMAMDDGFALGHEAIVNTFEEITSHRAKEAWKLSR